MFIYWQWRSTRGSISFWSGIMFSTAKLESNGSAELQVGRCFMFRNSVFNLRNFQISAVPSYKRVDLLILRNCLFSLRNVQIWAVLSINEVDLLMLRNIVFRLRNVQKCAVPSAKGLVCWCSRISFQGAKLSNMGCAVHQWGWFADAQEKRIQAAKRSEMGSAVRKGVGFLMLKNCVSRLQIVQIWVIPSSKGVDWLLHRNRLFRLRNFTYEQLRHERIFG